MGATLALDRVIVRVYGQAGQARNREEHEDFAITLRLLGLLRSEWPNGPGLFDLACGYAVGLPHGKYLFRRAARAAYDHQQLLRLIPDYDYSNDMVPENDPSDGRRKFYGNRFRNLAGEKLPRPDAEATSSEDADFASANWRSRSLEDADHCQSTEGIPRPEYRPGGALEKCGVTRKRISSNGQKLQLAAWHRRRLADAACCGA
jgi:hypothetical protein